MTDMQTPFALILHGGNARSAALEAIAFARQGDFQNASEKMTLARGDTIRSSYSNRFNSRGSKRQSCRNKFIISACTRSFNECHYSERTC